MGKWNHRSRYNRRRSPERWYSERHSSSSSSSCGYGEEDGIPVWEKRFCEVIGSVPWQKVVEATDFKSWYSGNVITWNDSACEETFHSEKKRFWSRVNGLRCDVSLPDPDLYISGVDWDTFVDPELIRDLETAYFAPPDAEVECGFKRGRRDRNWSGCDLVVPVEETPWEDSALGNRSNGWNLSESGADHPKDRVSYLEAKPSCGNEKANDSTSWGCWTTEAQRENQWKTKDRVNGSWENSGQGNDDNSGHQNKKARGSESVPAEEYEMLDNPWEAKPSCRKETAKETTWGGCSGKGWEDRGWNNESWGSGGWENQEWSSKGYSRDRGWNNDSWGSGGRENQEWHSKGYSRDIREPKGYNPWKAGFVPDNTALRDHRANAGGWQTRRATETKQGNWNVKRSSDGWGGQNKERDKVYGHHSKYRNPWPRRDDYQNRRVHFSAK
ncbi:PREDICTED: uncharacterized protein LOC104791442 [Camelina sativa]|uniref:Uncharacterized protein LOC104791442 n=1 Tax=Camelina sativa TaxID=90675 RepID=A0ABM0ZH23_CAMSA|nr:PREDICTED: uncharacterized protein LOC104791442 [Camelina sativa]